MRLPCPYTSWREIISGCPRRLYRGLIHVIESEVRPAPPSPIKAMPSVNERCTDVT